MRKIESQNYTFNTNKIWGLLFLHFYNFPIYGCLGKYLFSVTFMLVKVYMLRMYNIQSGSPDIIFLPITNLPILILVCKLKHLVNVLLLHRHRQVPHHELEVSLGEEFIFNFVLLCSEVGWVGVSATDYLNSQI